MKIEWIILIISILCLFFIGCRTDKDKLDTPKKPGIAIPVTGEKNDSVIVYRDKPLTKDQVKAIEQDAKLKTTAKTRKNLEWIQWIAAALLLFSGLAFFMVPANYKRLAIGGAIGAGVVVIVAHTLSKFIGLFEVITLILIIGSILVSIGLGILWFRKSKAFKTVVGSTQKIIDKHPETWDGLVKNGEIEHDKETKDQVKAAKK